MFLRQRGASHGICCNKSNHKIAIMMYLTRKIHTIFCPKKPNFRRKFAIFAERKSSPLLPNVIYRKLIC